MTDIVYGLRKLPADLDYDISTGSHGIINVGKLAHDAADEIERMRLFLKEIAAMGPADEEWDDDTLKGAINLAKRALAHQKNAESK